MRWRAIIGDNELIFGSPLSEVRFYELKGKPVTIELDDKPSAEQRRFFEGAVVIYAFHQCEAGWQDFKECREALKLEFLPGWTRNTKGESVQYARSTTELSKDGWRAFLGRIERWFMENGMEWPDPSEYKAWRDSGPLKGELYPPLQRLIDYRRSLEEPVS